MGQFLCLTAFLGGPLLSFAADANAPAEFKDDREKVSYALGVYFGTQVTNVIKQYNFEVDSAVVLEAIKQVLGGHPAKMSGPEVQAALRDYQTKRQQAMIDKNTKAGEAFLAENKNKPGVRAEEAKMLDGSTVEWQYKVITEGTGKLPESNDVAKVIYRGTLIDGTEFDSSAKHGGQPFSFPVGGNSVIRGWAEAVKHMKVGSKWEVYLPATLAYRDRGTPGIEPGSTLIFDMELVSAEPPPPPPAAPPALTSDIVRVPSAEEMKAGQKIEVIKQEDLARQAAAQNSQSKTNKK